MPRPRSPHGTKKPLLNCLQYRPLRKAKSTAAIPAESIPFIGMAVLIADTGYELYAACETVRDLDQLYSELRKPDEAPENVMHSVCDPELPDLNFD
jgi:hypothetical protein